MIKGEYLVDSSGNIAKVLCVKGKEVDMEIIHAASNTEHLMSVGNIYIFDVESLKRMTIAKSGNLATLKLLYGRKNGT